jgi:hypothetical protein
MRILKRVRDAVTGRFVKREEAWRRPESTVIQTFRVPPKVTVIGSRHSDASLQEIFKNPEEDGGKA